MRYRNNLKGNLSFKSFVPPLMADYTISESPALTKTVKETEASFTELNSRMQKGDETIFRKLMEDEARASYRLSEVKPRSCFFIWIYNRS